MSFLSYKLKRTNWVTEGYSCENLTQEPLRGVSSQTSVNMSRNVWKRTIGRVRSEKIQIRLRSRTVWSESSLGAYWIAKDAKFLHADNEDSHQTAQMRRLIWVFVGHACQKVHFLTFRLILAGTTKTVMSGIWTSITVLWNICLWLRFWKVHVGV